MTSLLLNFLSKIKNISTAKIMKINKIISNKTENHLGRWKIDECSKKTNIKVDMSNEDHCGPCGYYAMMTIKSKENSQNNLRIITKNIVPK